MAHSAALSSSEPGFASSERPSGGLAGCLRGLARAIRREQARRQLDALNDHLRRDIGLAPRRGRATFAGSADPHGSRPA